MDNHTYSATAAFLFMKGHLIMLKIIEHNEPNMRQAFLHNHTPNLLFRKRGCLGIATHFIEVDDWVHLTYQQMLEIRTDYEQTLR
jgi:hypothetical protein